jgi:DNA-binding MarR family transcriptional regulator
MTQAYAPLLEPFGLTYPQYLTMLVLWSADDALTVGEIGARLRLDSGTLTPVLKRLQTAGLVTRRRDPADERRVVVSVTAAGNRLQDDVVGVPVALAERIGLSLDESIALHRSLHRVLDRLDQTAAA